MILSFSLNFYDLTNTVKAAYQRVLYCFAIQLKQHLRMVVLLMVLEMEVLVQLL